MKFIFLLLVCFFPGFIMAQQLYVPAEIKESVKHKVRTLTGFPGEQYWQNKAEYNIQVELLAEEKKISGRQEVRYFNNSPDTLNRIIIRLYQNIYQKASMRNRRLAEADIHDGMTLSDLSIRGKKRDLNSRSIKIDGTVMTIPLFKSLMPGEVLEMRLAWDYPLPEQGLRQGVKEDSTFFIGYWYPQIAVYDDLFGWDTQKYVAVPEFYNDFYDFDVEIKVPEGYFVWATGDLQNPEEVYSNAMLEKLAKVNADSSVVLISEADLQTGGWLKNEHWHFKASSVCDFAWSASSNALWNSVMARVDQEGNTAVVNSVYPRNKQRQNEQVIDFAKASLEFFSLDNPGIPYPYSHHTTVNAWNSIAFPGGMEYPMMANNFEFNSPFNIIVTAHEIFHTYMPFYLGINEKKFTWMDEGWADYYDGKFLGSIAGEASRQFNAMTSQMWARTESGSMSDYPIMTTSEALTMELYQNHSTKPAIAFRVLENIIGEDKIKEALQEFSLRWQGKHPSSHDFFYTINDVAGEDLTWFWQPWFFEFGFPDLALEEGDKGLVVRKNGNLPVPFQLEVTLTNGDKQTIQESAGIWANGRMNYQVDLKKKNIASAKLLPGLFPDKYAGNNQLTLQ